MDTFNNVLEAINGVVWADWVLYAVLAVGLLFTIWSGFCQWRSLTHGVAVTAGKYDHPDDPGAISHFQALSAALSATVGLGNIAGVAIAIALGGPGAVFWMWVVGIAGMALKTTEVCQSMLFRNTKDPNNPHGGPMFVVHKGLSKWNLGWLGWILGAIFCVTLLISTITGGNMFQAWSVGGITREAMGVPNWITGVILAVIVALVIIGGIRRIGTVAGVLVPFMIVLYVITAVIVLIMHITEIPDLIGLIFASAFNPSEAGGAFVGGSAGYAFLWGMKRALFSSEAGQGSSPIAHSAAQTDEPVSEASVAGLEPFIDTLVVCTLTALVILSTGALQRGGDAGMWDASFNTPPPITVMNVEEKDADTGDAKLIPCWVIGDQMYYDHDKDADPGDLKLAGRTPLPDRKDEAKAIDGKTWRDGDMVFVVAEGDEKQSEDTASNRARFYGTVVIPSEQETKPYVRWKAIPIDEGDLAHFEHLAKDGKTLHLAFPALYKEYVGATLTAYAINRDLPGWGTYLILIAAWLFAISTMISWSYYGEQGVVFLFGEVAVPIYKIIYCALIVVATLPIVKTTKEIGNLSDLGTGVMLWSNIPIMLIFGFTAMTAYHSYFGRLRSGKIRRTKDLELSDNDN